MNNGSPPLVHCLSQTDYVAALSLGPAATFSVEEGHEDADLIEWSEMQSGYGCRALPLLAWNQRSLGIQSRRILTGPEAPLKCHVIHGSRAKVRYRRDHRLIVTLAVYRGPFADRRGNNDSFGLLKLSAPRLLVVLFLLPSKLPDSDQNGSWCRDCTDCRRHGLRYFRPRHRPIVPLQPEESGQPPWCGGLDAAGSPSQAVGRAEARWRWISAIAAGVSGPSA